MRPCEGCGRDFLPKRKGQRFCGRSCAGKNNNNMEPIPIESRFWNFVDKSAGPTACWLWTGARDVNGYGRASVDGRGRLAHRVAVWLTRGRWPEPFGLHSCDNPSCVNPDHIEDGDQAKNMADAGLRGRVCSGERHPSKVMPGRWLKKLTMSQISDAVSRVRAGERRCDVARGLGVSPEAIGYHLSRRST